MTVETTSGAAVGAGTAGAGAAGAALYDEAYARHYQRMYIEPWSAKHQLNRENLARLLEEQRSRPHSTAPAVSRDSSAPEPHWLDLACGQAWHFSQFEGHARQLGVDASEAQLRRARAACPSAEFLLADMSELGLPTGSFDLVTSFWGAYCYLASRERISRWLKQAVGWVREGGSLYLEVLLGEDLASFNRSKFAARTGFVVEPLSPDYEQWSYRDIGGSHTMTSPPLAFLMDIVEPAFGHVEARHDGSFMVHLIASQKRHG